MKTLYVFLILICGSVATISSIIAEDKVKNSRQNFYYHLRMALRQPGWKVAILLVSSFVIYFLTDLRDGIVERENKSYQKFIIDSTMRATSVLPGLLIEMSKDSTDVSNDSLVFTLGASNADIKSYDMMFYLISKTGQTIQPLTMG